MQSLPALGLAAYYWGTNCLHSLNGGECIIDSKGVGRCPTNFPSGREFPPSRLLLYVPSCPRTLLRLLLLAAAASFGAMFDRDLIKKMANVIGVELRAMLALGDN
eukprot:COSAG01_NODE_56788_length_316_cov_0.728111_1_plen_104_part_11